MIWQGKALGALIGVVAAGPLGALFGTFIGHLFDVQAGNGLPGIGAGGASAAHSASAAQVQEAFFRATFQVMGHLAKADGRVSEREIRAARAMMDALRLGGPEMRFAIELYREGKQHDYPLEASLRALYELCRNRPDLCRMFVQIQLQAALWGGSLDKAGRSVLVRVCRALAVSTYELVQMEALLRMQPAGARPEPQRTDERLASAYRVLGLEETASNREITKAYRRLMSRNHPDKLVARGLPESMMKLAQEKTRQIRAAYEVLRAARGMR